MSDSEASDKTVEGASRVSDANQGALAEDLLEILVCPLGKAPLRLEGDALVCTRCGAAYAVEDGIPNMLVEDARLPEGVTDVKDLACNSDAPA